MLKHGAYLMWNSFHDWSKASDCESLVSQLPFSARPRFSLGSAYAAMRPWLSGICDSVASCLIKFRHQPGKKFRSCLQFGRLNGSLFWFFCRKFSGSLKRSELSASKSQPGTRNPETSTGVRLRPVCFAHEYSTRIHPGGRT